MEKTKKREKRGNASPGLAIQDKTHISNCLYKFRNETLSLIGTLNPRQYFLTPHDLSNFILGGCYE